MRYWLSYTALMTIKSNIHGLFIHMTYLMKEWQSDSNKLQVGGQCVPTQAENIWMSISPFFWDGTASSVDRCPMFWNSKVVSSSRVSWRWEHNTSRFALQNSNFRNWEQSLPNKTPDSKTVFCCLVITCNVKGLNFMFLGPSIVRIF